MKKLNLILLFVATSFSAHTQELKNGDFEEWMLTLNNGKNYDTPSDWVLYTQSFQDTNYSGDRSRHLNNSGRFSICIQSLGGDITGKDYPSYLSYGSKVGRRGDVKPKKWGVPYTGRPMKVKGEYKFYNNQNTNDAGYAYLLLKKYNPISQRSDTLAFGSQSFPIASGDFEPWGSSGYIPFEMEIEYRNKIAIPDTMILVFVDSKYQEYGTLNKYNGGLFFIDNVSLVENPSSITDKNEVVAAFVIYPNPTNAILGINTSLQLYKLVVYQSNGIKILETKSTENLDVSALPEGLYLLEAIDMEGRRVLKKFEKR